MTSEEFSEFLEKNKQEVDQAKKKFESASKRFDKKVRDILALL